MEPSREIGRLVEIMARLRNPETGCAWDLAQDFTSIAPYTIEEAYEVADAIARGDLLDLKDELGDLLLQVAFHARMAEERGAFDFGDVVAAITAKLIRRHPHVFGAARDLSPDQVKAAWDEIKRAEKTARADARGGKRPDDREGGVLADVPLALPALTRAQKLSQKAAAVGFDWPDPAEVLGKIREELAEVEDAMRQGSKPAMADEVGDLLFSVANLARHLGLDPEAALRGTNAKFERRFAAVEAGLRATGQPIAAASLAQMEDLWRKAKAAEQAPPAGTGSDAGGGTGTGEAL